MKAMLLILVLGLVSPVQEPIEYNWSKEYKLKTSDFQVDPYIDGNKLAYISVSMNLNLNYGGTRACRAYATANRRLSGISQKVLDGYRTQEILDHEKLHFDIVEYVTRLLNSQLVHISEPSIAQKIYKEYSDTLDLVQAVYDAQTDHSNDTLWQHKWRANMDKLLWPGHLSNDWRLFPNY